VNFVDAVAPWLLLALIIFLLLRVQGAIQRRIFGVGWLIAADHNLAAVIYTLVLFPGILLHEVTEWLTAGVMNFKTIRSMRWPEADENGELDPKFVTVEYPKREKALGPPGPAARAKALFGRAIVEIAPTMAGLALTLFISNTLLGFPILIKELPSGDLARIGPAFRTVIQRPDFFLWFYVLFTISNSMMPRKFARHGLAILALCAAVAMIFLAILGFSRVVEQWLLGPIPAAVNQLSAISLLVLTVDLVVFALLYGLEFGAERVTQRQAPYKTAQAKALAVRQARATMPQLTSIHQYRVPIPTVADVATIKVRKPHLEPTGAPAPALEPGRVAPRPGLGSEPRPALSGPERPAIGAPKPEARPAMPERAEPSSGFGGSRPSQPAQPPSSAPAAASPFATPRPAEQRPAASAGPNIGAPGAPRPPEQRPPPPPGGSTGGSAPRPAGSSPPPSPFSKPAPTGGSATLPPRPALPASTANPPTSNPPAISKPGLPAMPGAVPQRGAPPVGAPKSSIFASNPIRKDKDEDVIDAEVIDDHEEDPGFTKGVRYEDLEDTP
jgi:hypothetical protein